jgi:hypothetical protein
MLGRCADLSEVGEPSKIYTSIPLQYIYLQCILLTSSREIDRYETEDRKQRDSPSVD